MITGVITTSILQKKAENRNVKNIARAPYDIQIDIFRETLSDIDSYLDTSDLLKLTSKSLKVIRDDILEIINGIRDVRTKIPLGYVKSLDGTLEGLRLARDAMQVALGMFDPAGQVNQSKSKKFYSELMVCRKNIEKANQMFSPRTKTFEEPPSDTKKKRTKSISKPNIEQPTNVSPTVKTSDIGANQPPPELPVETTSESSSQEPPVEPSETISAYQIQDNALEKHAATDKPIQDIEQDKLGFGTYVRALHDFIVSEYTTTPLTISVDGPWGAGKSSLMYMLKNSLEPQNKPWQKFVLWLKSTFRWWKWFLLFLPAFPVQIWGRMLLRIALKFDKTSQEFDFRMGKNHSGFRSLISDINSGLSTNPEVLEQKHIELSPRVRQWAKVRAKCEPMKADFHPTIWLNAWKFDNQEEVWASLALATLEQIRQKHNIFWIVWFRIRLTFMRLSTLSALGLVFLQFILPLILGILVFFYQAITQYYGTTVAAFDKITDGYGYYMLWAGAIVSGILTVRGLFKDPFQIAVDKVFNRPNYKEKVGFLTRFENDFARIVELSTSNGFGWKRSKLIIFVDDLDRCEPPRAADVVEAINLFLDAEGCIFVVGMDSDTVAMSIEVKYKDLFARLQAENAGIVSLGRAFLEKIVQIPFTVPRPTPDQILTMVKHTLGGIPQNNRAIRSLEQKLEDGKPKEDQKQEARNSPLKIDTRTDKGPLAEKVDPASFAREEVRKAIDLGTELLSENPRQAKTFVNLFRLSIYIANARGFIEEWRKGEEARLIGLERLAIWVVCTVRWQTLIRHLYIEAQYDSLRDFLSSTSKTIPRTYKWKKGTGIPNAVKKKLTQLRESEKDSAAHWCHLPWEWWLLETDFLKCIKLSDELWAPSSSDQIDWLAVLLTMSKPISQ